MEERKVKLVCTATGEQQLQMTVDGGRLDWTAVKEAFQAEVVQIIDEGVPSCFQAGEKTGLTRTTFNLPELEVSVVKKGHPASFSIESSRQLQELHSLAMQQEVDRKKAARQAATLRYSDVHRSEFEQIQKTARLTIHAVDLAATASKTIPPFGWDDRTERAQADRYMPFLSQHIRLGGGRGVAWVEAANCHPLLLSSDTLASLGCKLRGTTDVVVADRAAIRSRMPQAGMRLLLELKKVVKADHVFQALAGLIVANILCPEHRPVMVLTDLADEWQVQWMDGTAIYTSTMDDRASAVGLLEHYLEHSDDLPFDAAVDSSNEQHDQLAKRRRVDDRLIWPEIGGQILPEDAADVMSPAELTSLKISHMLNMLGEMPIAASLRPVPSSMYG